jgi:hypothetical protein
MGCSSFQGAPPPAIGFSIILLILTDSPHASVQTSILGESDGGPLHWMSLLPLSVDQALPLFDAGPRHEAAWLRFLFAQAPDHLAAVAARLPI